MAGKYSYCCEFPNCFGCLGSMTLCWQQERVMVWLGAGQIINRKQGLLYDKFVLDSALATERIVKYDCLCRQSTYTG